MIGRWAPAALVAVLAIVSPAAAAPRGLPGGYVDYAPSGMPDVSQCRREWSQAGTPAQWTYAGPVALADALWYLDSVAEPDPAPPPAVRDGHALVTVYPRFGPRRDDHDTANIGPLVEDLAFRANTDGRRRRDDVRGTRWLDLVEATATYIRERGLIGAHPVVTVSTPTSAWLASRAAQGAGTVLLLGVWESHAEGWRRVGGHYAAVAGADRAAGTVSLADPLADRAAQGGVGRAVPPDPASHGCRANPGAHDDAAVVAHDTYRLADEPELPGGRLVIAGYFTAASYGEAAAFQGQNPSAAAEAWAADWTRGPVVMAVDAAVSVAAAGGPPPMTDTPPPPATATDPPPTATTPPTPIADGTPTAQPGPTFPPFDPRPTVLLPFAWR